MVKKPRANTEKIRQTKEIAEEFKRDRIKVIIGIIMTVIALAMVVILVIYFCNKSTVSNEQTGPTSDTEELTEVDYNQKIVSVDDKEFSFNYELGSKTDFSVKFADLTCKDEQCENINNVKLGDKSLTRDKDYRVQQGSVIIIILANTMESLEIGEYDLICQITEHDKTMPVGIRFTVEDKIPTCKDDEVLDGNKCIKKQSEQVGAKPTTSKPSNNTNVSQPSNQPSQPAQSNTPTPTPPQPTPEPIPTTPQPTPEQPKTYSDYELIEICSSAIKDKYGAGLYTKKGDDMTPKVSRSTSGRIVTVSGWRASLKNGGLSGYIKASCTILDGKVSNISTY